jgi:hypothetical protein
MKKAAVEVGLTYVVKVSGRLAPVKIESVSEYGGWVGRNTRTGREIRIRSAQKLRRVVTPDNTPTLDERIDGFRQRTSVLRNDPITHSAYRGYLIRWSVFSLDKPDNKFWVERDNHFICWANSLEHAKQQIDLVA